MDKYGIYVHIPFCVKKCNYCDFPSYPGFEGIFHDYAAAVCTEIENTRNEYGVLEADTIFFGGGTPSLLSPQDISLIFNAIEKSFRLTGDAEISLEANPGTLSEDKLKAYRDLGFNRISLGLQAAQNRLLQFMGRIHNREQFLGSIRMAKESGFDNINADAIFGIPGQSMEDWLETVELLLSEEVAHISAYSLQIEEGTPWYNLQQQGKLPEVDESLEREMYYLVIKRLEEAGFHHYEISNFSRPGKECRHNLKYWTGRPYFGFGAAAHSFVQDKRLANQANPMEYIRSIKKCESARISEDKIGPDEKLSERLILGTRLISGVSLTQLEQEFGSEALQRHRAAIEKLTAEGLICFDGDMLRLTKRGLDYANQVWMEFL